MGQHIVTRVCPRLGDELLDVRREGAKAVICAQCAPNLGSACAAKGDNVRRPVGVALALLFRRAERCAITAAGSG
jgi:hypothetical protein